MKKEEKLLNDACQMCECYSIDEQCENHNACPVYNLYKLATKKKKTKVIEKDDFRGMQGYCDFEPQLPPEMI